MKNSVADRVILKKIYDLYYSEFTDYDEENPNRTSKIYVPIDCTLIAKKLNIDPEILFGRLYYHLEKKYGYKTSDNTYVRLFAQKIGSDMHLINFPLLSAILAEHESSFYKFLIPIVLSTMALTVSLLTLFLKYI